MITTAQQAPLALASNVLRVKNTFVHIEPQFESGNLEIDASEFRRTVSEPSPVSLRLPGHIDLSTDSVNQEKESTEHGKSFQEGAHKDVRATHFGSLSSVTTTQDSLADVTHDSTDGSLPDTDQSQSNSPEVEPLALNPMMSPPMSPPLMWLPVAAFGPMPPPLGGDSKCPAMLQFAQRRHMSLDAAQDDNRKPESLIRNIAQQGKQVFETQEQRWLAHSTAAASKVECDAVAAAVRERLERLRSMPGKAEGKAEGKEASPNAGAKFCVFCGGAIMAKYKFCRFCGVRL